MNTKKIIRAINEKILPKMLRIIEATSSCIAAVRPKRNTPAHPINIVGTIENAYFSFILLVNPFPIRVIFFLSTLFIFLKSWGQIMYLLHTEYDRHNCEHLF
jgi:hypothetical protein